MDFALTDEQRAIVDTVRQFVERELVPHEDEVEQLDEVTPELAASIRTKALAAGLYAANMPEDVGGAGPGRGLARPGRARAGAYVVRAAPLRGTTQPDPDGLHRRPDRQVPAAHRPRREAGVPGHHRARRRL